MHFTLSLFTIFAAVAAVSGSISRPTDFIVVGSGTAGCTIAATLCEKLPKATVTLIERGAKRDDEAKLQSLATNKRFEAWENPDLTAFVESEPNSAMNNRTLTMLVGNNIGGGSAINSGQLLLPPVGTFDSWGISGLSDTRAEQLFALLQAAQSDTGVPSPDRTPTYTAEWKTAASNAGFPFTSDPYERPRTQSVSFDAPVAFNSKGQRMDSCRTFLRPALRGKCKGRVRVLRGVRAERILFSLKKTARAVQVSRPDGTKLWLYARREVLLAAGAIETPALLQRSGVGPKDDIEGIARRFVRDLPVGEKLHSRVVTPILSFYGRPLAPVNDPAVVNAPGAEEQFRQGLGGPLAIEPLGALARFGNLGYGGVQIGLPGTAFGAPLILTYCVSDSSDTSFGTVKINTGRGETSTTPPVVDLRQLEKAEDLDRAARCVQNVRSIHKELEPLLFAGEIFADGFDADRLSTLDGVRDLVRQESLNAYHLAGTCAVGEVVDDKLRVLGMNRIRVVDSAAIPLLPRTGGPMVSVYIVALHAAELVANAHPDLV